MNIRELTAKLGFEIDERPLERLEVLVEGVHRRLEFLAGVELARKLFEMAENFSHWGSEVLTTAENLGVATDSLQKLRFAAERSGIGAEAMSHSLQVLSTKIYDVQNGGEKAQGAMRSFVDAGFSPEQVKKFNTAEEALSAFSEIIAKTDNQFKRAALTQEFLGRGGSKFVSFLAQGPDKIKGVGAEMQKLGLVLSRGQLKALEETENSFQKLFGVFKAIGAIIASTIGPVFSFLIDKVLGFYAANRSIIEQNIERWLISFARAIGFVTGLVVGLLTRLVELAKRFNVENDILKYTGWIAGLTGAFGALGAAVKFLGGILSGAWEFSTFGVALTAIGVAAHDIMAVMNGEPTWIGQAAKWVSQFEPVKNVLEMIGDKADSLHEKFNAKRDSIEKNIRSSVKAGAEFLSNEALDAIGSGIARAMIAALKVADFAIDIGQSIAKGFLQGIADAFGGDPTLNKNGSEPGFGSFLLHGLGSNAAQTAKDLSSTGRIKDEDFVTSRGAADFAGFIEAAKLFFLGFATFGARTGGVTINSHPTINVNGSGDTKGDHERAANAAEKYTSYLLREAARELVGATA